MRKILTLLLVLGAASAESLAAPVVLIMGDSLSAGYGIDVDQSWPALLQSRLESQGYEHRVVNASISGETTEGGATRIGAALAKHDPELVVIELGGNDGLRGFPPELVKRNLKRMIEATRASGAAAVLLGIRIPVNYGERYRRAFEQVYRDVAHELDVPWNEFFLEGVATDPGLMQPDGIHPNADAQPLMLDNAWPAISEALSPEPAAAAVPASR